MRWQKDDLVHHFVEALDQAEVTHAPFSPSFAQNLFPQDVYHQHLMTLLPVIDGYKPQTTATPCARTAPVLAR